MDEFPSVSSSSSSTSPLSLNQDLSTGATASGDRSAHDHVSAQSNGTSSSLSGNATPSNGRTKPLRAMIARGAACNTCRARKVKCDAVRPICSQCLKSARGNASACKCVYDGQGTVAVSGSAGSSAPQKQKRLRVDTDEDTARGRARKLKTGSESGDGLGTAISGEPSNGSGGRGRVESLMERITELERRLHSQGSRVGTSTSPVAAADALTDLYRESAQHVSHDISKAAHDTDRSSTSYASTRPTFGNSPYPPSGYNVESSLPQPSSSHASQTGTITSQAPQSWSPLMWSVSSAGSRQGGLESPVDTRKTPSTTLSSISSASTKDSPLFAQPTPPGGVGLNALSPPDFTFPAMPVLHTMWPSSLPSPATVHHLVELFFCRCVLPATIFDAPRILASLLENPASGAFPETALLHAIMSYASPHGSEDCIEGRYWDVLGEGRSRRRWHYELALDEFEKASALIFQPALNRCGMSRGLKPDAPSSTSNWRPIRPTNPLQVVQASIVCSLIAHQLADFPNSWRLAGLSQRLSLPLGLNKLPAWDYARNQPAIYPDKSLIDRTWLRGMMDIVPWALLGPPRDLEEYHERARTFWLAFAIDRQSSSVSEWGSSLDERDITTHIPLQAGAQLAAAAVLENKVSLQVDPRTAQIPGLSIHSEELFEVTTAPIGSLGLCIKACVLIGRVVTFLQRLPQLQNLPPGVTLKQIRDERTNLPEFRKLEYTLALFRKTIARDFERDGMTDSFLFSAFTTPHLATILLHERFVDREDQREGSALNKTLISAKCIINALAYAASTSNDFASWDPLSVLAWQTAGRVLIRDAAIRELWGHTEQAATSREMAQQCILCIQAMSHGREIGVANACLMALQSMFDDPEILLPPRDQDVDAHSNDLASVNEFMAGVPPTINGNGNGNTGPDTIHSSHNGNYPNIDSHANLLFGYDGRTSVDFMKGLATFTEPP